MVKLASTKRKRTAQHGGTAGQMVTACNWNLKKKKKEKGKKKKKKTLLTVLVVESMFRSPGKYPSFIG